MHPVDIPVHDELNQVPVGQPSQPPAHGGVRKRLLVAFVLACGEHRAPAPFQIVSRDLEKVGPLLRIGDVAARAAAERGLEVEERREDEKPFGPGVTLERDVQALAHRAAPAVAADHIVEDMLRRNQRAFGVLRHIGDARSEPHLDVRHRRKPPQAERAELVLLGLHDEWVGCLVAQHLVIELRDKRLRRPVPELEVTGDKAQRLELLEKPELGEHLERGGVRSGCARAVIDFPLGLEERDSHPLAGAGDCGYDTDRAGPDDAHSRRHRAGRDSSTCRCACPAPTIPRPSPASSGPPQAAGTSPGRRRA